MSHLKSIITKRRLAKGTITRALNFALHPPIGTSLQDAVTRIERLDVVFKEFQQYTAEIYEYEDTEGYIDPEQEFIEYEEKYVTAKGKLIELKLALQPQVEVASSSNDIINRFAEQQSQFFQRMSDSPINVIQGSNELPKIKIEPFSGNYKDWPEFKDLFTSEIHSKTNLTNTQKFHYLKSFLRNEAANLIKHMQITDASYSTAWERLNDRFDRPRHIVHSYIETFMSIPPVKEENTAGLRRISDISNEVIRGLEAISKNERDHWLIFILQNKLDVESRKQWIQASRENQNPSISEFLTFLDHRCEELELGNKNTTRTFNFKPNTSNSMVAYNATKQCEMCCSADHTIYKCSKFQELNVEQRRLSVKDKSLCFNCLKPGHTVYHCSSQNACRNCKKRHHTLLHILTNNSASFPSVVQQEDEDDNTADSAAISLNTVASSSISSSHKINFILPTALVDVRDIKGSFISVRVLLDTASELSYITEDCLKRLGLQRKPSKIAIAGISSVKAETTHGHANVFIKSKHNSSSLEAEVHVLNRITSLLPKFSMTASDKSKLENFQLADPTLNRSSKIDILLGTKYVWDIFEAEKIRNEKGKIIAVNSIFGYIITALECHENRDSPSLSFTTLVDIDRTLRSFWEIENCNNKLDMTEDEIQVEQHFRDTHSRHLDGKYVVELPFRNQHQHFANTYNGALRRLVSTEKRLNANKQLKEKYVRFMNEYLNLNHMRELSSNEISVGDAEVFYLPHHPVIGDKIRVVFDGSFEDTDGVSLNSQLHIGPPIQRNLFAVCLRFRLHKYVFSADIIKMFRQIWVKDSHRDFQRILWRSNLQGPIKHYQLCTVTYGTAPAPFLSVRVLEQLAKDYKNSYPIGSRIILEDFYVDDVLTGASSEEELLAARNDLKKLLSEAGFSLSKWVTNSKQLLSATLSEVQEEPSFLQQGQEESKKVLGIRWNSFRDTITYKVNLSNIKCSSKRMVLSDVARIFDPLGLVSPVVVKFKILFQQLWLLDINWDDPLPPDLATQWFNYRQDLQHIEKLSINRFIPSSCNKIELHGFSDASTKAYSAVVYCRTEDGSGNIQVSLMASKTRVSPLKQISLPRLELCGALLLSRLIKSITASLSHQRIELHAWCDSTVVLSWLSMQPVKLKTFIANRTSEILDTLPRSVWKHVISKENPADCASRGLLADQLLQLDLWWHGPLWLKNPASYKVQMHRRFEDQNHNPDVVAEVKNDKMTIISTEAYSDHPLDKLINRVSSWWKIVRVTAYIRRYITNLKLKAKPKSIELSFEELVQARIFCLKFAQFSFKRDVKCLKENVQLPRDSKLLKLTPYIDKNGLLRVGGRIQNSTLSEETQHQIILPKEHKITFLIILEEHAKNLHPGVSSLFFIIRQKYWIFGARNIIRKITHQCLKCFRQAQHSTTQQMANLPTVRVRQAFPFQNVGCDYAGPISLKMHRGRNPKTTKGYICVFVCMVTSAIHLELSTDLSTDCYLAALRRFMARRGKCSHIFSDNGKNFVGANRKLNEMLQHVQAEKHNEIIKNVLSKEGIQWSFIPPYSPHWGGIWESSVRSVKLHLRRVIGSNILTYDQMHTLLAQVEAVVNSRPLGTTSDTETNYLSPSHFLLGRPSTMIPETDLTAIPTNRLDYWQHVQCMYQGFWNRWSQEYLTALQQRPKWYQVKPNIEINDIVLVKEDKTPPSTWITGRVVDTFPGEDGLIRVVKLKSNQGEMTRPISKIIKMPFC